MRVLDEDVPPRKSGRWGYEGNTSMMVYGRAAERWADDIEDLIAGSVDSHDAAIKREDDQSHRNGSCKATRISTAVAVPSGRVMLSLPAW